MEAVDWVWCCFIHSPGFTVVKKDAGCVCVESSNLYCVSSRRSFDTCLILSIASLANLFLRLISSDVLRRVPRYMYLHFFHSVLPFFVMLYSSVFSGLMSRFLVWSCLGILLLTFWILCLLFMANQQMSSAYCSGMSSPVRSKLE